MKNDGRTTSEQLYIPSLLIVGGTQSLLLRCLHASKPMGLAIKACTAADAALVVARRHPIAIVVPNDVFDSAAHELAALARDVRSTILQVDPEVSVRELEAMIAAAVDGGFTQRERRGGAGCYSIVEGGIEEEAPFSRRTLPPEAPSDGRSSRVPSPGIVSTRPSIPPASMPPASVRPSVVSAQLRPSVPPASVRVSAPPASVRASAPPVSRTLPAPAPPAAAESVPPVSGVQQGASGAFAAIRSVFSSRR